MDSQDPFPEFLLCHEFISFIGEGSFAKVYKIRRLADQEQFALKVVELNMNATRELGVSRLLQINNENCPNILHYKEAWISSHQPTTKPINFPITGRQLLYIKTELCDSTLREMLLSKGAPNFEKDITGFAKQIATGLSFIHEKNLMHRDLNPGNILIKWENGNNEKVAKIGDFGLSRFIPGVAESLTTRTTISYVASTISVRNRTGAQKYTQLCDVFSFGVVLYEMFHPEVLVSRIGETDYSFHRDMTNVIRIEDNVRSDALGKIENHSLSELIGGMLQTDPVKRPYASLLIEIIDEIL